MLLVALALCEAGTANAFASGGERRSSLGTITGTVLDSRGKPLAGALVTVLRDGVNEVVKQTRSGADGSFVTRVTPGRYLIRALAEGFNPATFTSVNVSSSSELVYRFNLQPAGEGNTTPERRADRNDPKFKIRASHSRRSVFNVDEEEEAATVARGDEVASTPAADETGAGEGVEFEDATIYVGGAVDADSRARKRTRTQGFLETYYAASNGPAARNFGGLNFALATPVNRQVNLVFAGQLGELDRLEATARVRANTRHLVSATIGGALMPLLKDEPELRAHSRKLGQVSVRAVDEWVVRDGIVVVMGLDYSRFFGAGNADSLSPRLGFSFDADSRTRLRAAYAPGPDAATRVQSAANFEDGPVLFKESAGQAVALVDGEAVLERSHRLEFGVERVLDESSSVEATAFFDTTDNRGVGLLGMTLDALNDQEGAGLLTATNQQGAARGVRVVYTRRISQHLKASAGYAFGRGQKLSSEGITEPDRLFRSGYFQTAAAQVDADLFDGTRVRTVLRFSSRASVFAIDPFAGRLAVYDPSLSILVTQELPNFGLPLRAEAMLDARNLFDVMSTAEDGDAQLSANLLRRMIRGGISVRF